MRKKLKWLNSPLKILSFMILATVVFISCADDQDATNATRDSANLNTTDTTPETRVAVNGKDKREPQDMPDATVTRLALLTMEANQYNVGTRFIIKLPNDVDSNWLLKNGYGRWYQIKEDSLPDPFNPRNRERLTNNIYGYLTYHDMVVAHPAPPHTLFLQWYRRGNKIDSVVVWIKPVPVFSKEIGVDLLESDPPRPKVPPPPAME